MVKQTIITLFLISTIIGCSPKVPQASQSYFEYKRSGQVNFLNSSKNLLTVVSEQSAENMNKAISFAEINALENVLYRGIPGSPQENPLIPNEVEAIRNSSLVLKGLVFENGYKIFLTDSEVIDRYDGKGVITVRQRVTFDINALRKFLENNEVIRKFGL